MKNPENYHMFSIFFLCRYSNSHSNSLLA